MKKALYSGLVCTALLIGPGIASAQDGSAAGSPMTILKKMSDQLKSRPSFSLATTSFYDEKFENQLIKSMVSHRVDVVRPSTLYAEAIFDDGDRWVSFFDGKMLRIYEPAEKEYSEIPFAGTVSQLVDVMDASGLTKTPINDFLRADIYAAFEPAIFDATLLDGSVDPRNGDKTNHLLFQSHGTTWQLWVDNAGTSLPKRLVVTYADLGRPEYIVSFDDWKFDQKPGELAAKYNIPSNVDGWKKVDFINPVKFR